MYGRNRKTIDLFPVPVMDHVRLSPTPIYADIAYTEGRAAEGRREGEGNARAPIGIARFRQSF